MRIPSHADLTNRTFLLERFGALFAFVVGACVTIPFLDWFYVFQVSEAREGSVTLELLRTGNVILPYRLGSVVPSKPPLFHWISAALASLDGGYAHYYEFLLRLPSALAASLLAAALFFIGRSLRDGVLGALSAAVLLTTYGFLRLAADGRVDMLFCLLVTSSVSYWIPALASRKKRGLTTNEIPNRVFFVSAVLAGLAVLAKGPLGLLLPLLVIFAISWGEERWKGIRAALRPMWLVTIAISAPWYLAAAANAGKTFVDRQLVFENLERFVGGEAVNTKPFWFYLVEFWGHAAPWSVVCGVVLVAALVRPASIRAFFAQLSEDDRRIFRVCGYWFAVQFLFFSLAAGKRSAYLLPTVPPLTIALALAFQIQFLRAPLGTAAWRRIETLGVIFWIAVLSSGFAAYALIHADPSVAQKISPRLIQSLDVRERALTSIQTGLIPFFQILAIASIMFWLLGSRRRRIGMVLAATFLTLQIPLSVYANAGMTFRGLTHSFHDFAGQVSSIVPADRTLQVVKGPRDESLDTFFFYYRRPVGLIAPENNSSASGYVLVRNDSLNIISWNYKTLAVGGRIANDPDEQWSLLLKQEPTS